MRYICLPSLNGYLYIHIVAGLWLLTIPLVVFTGDILLHLNVINIVIYVYIHLN